MPALSQETIGDIELRLRKFLDEIGPYEEVEFLKAGGSAAVFKVVRQGRVSAVKGFNPTFFVGTDGDADRRRLEVQRRLIGHPCKSLVQTYGVYEAQGTAFIEMEFVAWPQLKDKLDQVPDAAVVSLITQLVEAVRFLEDQGIVHRDIKPENIHVTDDFSALKLLDLGVVRDFEASDEADVAATDHGRQRPFLATAQYSSPDYLFRLDEPTARLWKGLNLYQVGAVLHDLIKRQELFAYEMGLNNRWLVARAVLTKRPTFDDSTSNRLSHLKALALRCLEKDLETRLQIVGWEDFILEDSADPVAKLRGRLAKRVQSTGEKFNEGAAARLEFLRAEFQKRFTDRVRSELSPICGNQMPFTLKVPQPGGPPEYLLQFALDGKTSVCMQLSFEWLIGVREKSANIGISALLVNDAPDNPAFGQKLVIGTVTVQEGEDEAAAAVVEPIARVLTSALDIVEGEGAERIQDGMDLQNYILRG